MPPVDLSMLVRTIRHDRKEVTILRPGIALTVYSDMQLTEVMRATGTVLRDYLNFVPPGSIAAIYRHGPDEYTPGGWVPFDADERRRLLTDLDSLSVPAEDEGYGFVLAGTPDGQAADHGVRFGGIVLSTPDNGDDVTPDADVADENETSVLRLEFPWNLCDQISVDSVLGFVERTASIFPYCSGHVGFSFNHTVSFVPETRDEIDKLALRFIGFDTAHTSMQLELRGKTPPAHWLNLLNMDLINALGGEARLRSAIKGAEIRKLTNGVLIRGAKLPPVGDVNRGARDIGLLPEVARAIKPIRLDLGLFAGLRDAERGQAWLERFDNLPSREWDNT